MFKIDGVVSQPYAPQANTVERFHRWLGAALRILLHDFDLDIEESLPHILWIWRATVCRVTGFTPFALHHGGRVMRFPRDVFEGNVAETTHEEYCEHLSLWSQALTCERLLT